MSALSFSSFPAHALPPRGMCESAFEIKENIRLGQLLIIGFDGIKPEQKSVKTIRNILSKGHLSGVVFFDRNIKSRKQIKRLTSYLAKANNAFPPLLAVDEEGGYVQRLLRRNGFAYEHSAWWVAQHKPPLAAYNYYRKMADHLKAAGFNLNFAPTIDLASNLNNPVIAKLRRAYSADPLIVTSYASMFIRAHKSRGIITALKHFPGHGSSSADSHKRLADVTKSWKANELTPFARLIDAGQADMVMTGHVLNKRLWSENNLPASLSPILINELLRGTLGYNGVVITDDLQMNAISRRFSHAKAAVAALKAGNDMVLIGNALGPTTVTPQQLLTHIKTAAHNGDLDQRALACSFLRVMQLKKRRLH